MPAILAYQRLAIAPAHANAREIRPGRRGGADLPVVASDYRVPDELINK